QDLVGILGECSGDLAWGDYDNDGDLDLVLAGTSDTGRVALVFSNDGSGMLALDPAQVLTRVSQASVAWGDYDNDGDLDLYVQGHDGVGGSAVLYENDPLGTLAPTPQVLTGLWSGSADWGDYDGDGYADLLATGGAGGGVDTTIFYHNNQWGGLIQTGGHSIPGVGLSDAAFGDYDADGDLDVAVTGNTGTIKLTRVYQNDGIGTYTQVLSSPYQLYRSSCAWGDYDTDGDMDVAFFGYTGASLYTLVYENAVSGFTYAFGLTGVREGSLNWADVDEDGGLDFFMTGADWNYKYTRLYARTGGEANTPPAPPSELEGHMYIPLIGPPGALMLSWDGASDAETPAPGLYYCVRVGTTPGGHEVLSGTYSSPLMGNVGQATSISIDGLPMQVYYWSVRTIDSGLRASAWAPEQILCPEYIYHQEIDPADDATVDAYYLYADSTFGTWVPAMLHVGAFSGAGDIARAYLKFYVGGSLPPGAQAVYGALHVELMGLFCGSSYYVDCWEEWIDAWDESTITWNNAPTMWRPTPLDRQLMSGLGEYTWDVTDAVRSNVDGNITLVLRAGSPPEGGNCLAEYWSKDQTYGPKPYLEYWYTITATGLEGSEEVASSEPPSYRLDANAPNPFNPATTIRFGVPERCRATLKIYDLSGREVRTLVEGVLEAGNDHGAVWDGKDRAGRDAASGVYFYRLTAGERVETKKMMLLR
ncbi:MAG: FG-GAP-like repeat-containing protein, partial [Candidatus Eisenbacteria bacterium]